MLQQRTRSKAKHRHAETLRAIEAADDCTEQRHTQLSLQSTLVTGVHGAESHIHVPPAVTVQKERAKNAHRGHGWKATSKTMTAERHRQMCSTASGWHCGVHTTQLETSLILLCFALLSSHLQVKPTHSLHTTTHKLSRHAYTLPCPMGGGSYDEVDTIDVQAPCWEATRQCGGYSR